MKTTKTNQSLRLPVNDAGSQERAIYNSLVEKYGQKVVTYSYLRLEVDLSASQGSIRFPMLVNDSPSANANEKRLNVGDAFMVTQIGFFLYKLLTAAKRSSAILNSFPNPILYSGTNEAANLMALYNGSMSISIDRNELVPALDMMQFLAVGQAQQGVLTAASGTNNAYVRNEFLSGYGSQSLLPAIKASGSIVNDFIVQPAESGDMSGTSSTNTAVLLLRGFLIQNGASFKEER